MAKPTIQKTRNQGFEPRLVGAEVRRLREEKGMSQDELSKTARVAKQGISNLERGTVVPSIPILDRIAGVLGADLADLIRTGYDRNVMASSSTLTELNHLASKMTDDQRELALALIKVVASKKVSSS